MADSCLSEMISILLLFSGLLLVYQATILGQREPAMSDAANAISIKYSPVMLRIRAILRRGIKSAWPHQYIPLSLLHLLFHSPLSPSLCYLPEALSPHNHAVPWS